MGDGTAVCFSGIRYRGKTHACKDARGLLLVFGCCFELLECKWGSRHARLDSSTDGVALQVTFCVLWIACRPMFACRPASLQTQTQNPLLLPYGGSPWGDEDLFDAPGDVWRWGLHGQDTVHMPSLSWRHLHVDLGSEICIEKGIAMERDEVQSRRIKWVCACWLWSVGLGWIVFCFVKDNDYMMLENQCDNLILCSLMLGTTVVGRFVILSI
jgi:hypothetical protein